VVKVPREISALSGSAAASSVACAMIELLTTAEMGEADRLTIAAGTSGSRLMENAGRAVADAVVRRSPRGAPMVCVVAGPGNNGGDGLVCARVLAERGYPVRLLLLGDRDRLKGDAAEAAQRWQGPVEAATPSALGGAEVIVDALFGAGLDRPVEGQARAMIEAINAAGVPVIAVDLPSGINGDSGAVLGAAVDASETVTFFRRKPAHLLLPGRPHCGAVEVADIGIPESVLESIGPATFANAEALWAERFPVPRPGGHKYRRGHAVVVSGDRSHTGAARLAARGALRAGAGLVTLASPREALAVNAADNLAIMVRPIDGAEELAAWLDDPRLNAIVLGPGGGVGPSMREMVLAALSGERAVVLDADALTSFAEAPEALFAAIKSRGAMPAVLTPHEGEFARLFKDDSQAIENVSKCDRAKAAARASGAVVLLKGSDTVVASPQGRVSVTENAPPWLATAGSGDVLAGFVAGLLAQGMPGFEAASAAAWLHGEAGSEAGPGLIAEDLPEALRMVYRRLFVDLGVWP
jgi:ADP-dependent NAD(P)H-hydrate dehydratase / NAD(P)H-hydrate epimerase